MQTTNKEVGVCECGGELYETLKDSIDAGELMVVGYVYACNECYNAIDPQEAVNILCDADY